MAFAELLQNPMNAALFLVSFTGGECTEENKTRCKLMANQMMVEEPTQDEFDGVYEVCRMRLTAEHESKVISDTEYNDGLADLRVAMETLSKYFGGTLTLLA